MEYRDPTTRFLEGYVDFGHFPHMSSETKAQLREIADNILNKRGDREYLYNWLDSLIASAQDYEDTIAEYKQRAEYAEINRSHLVD